MTIKPPQVSKFAQTMKDLREKQKEDFLTKLYFEHQAKEAEKTEIERKKKLIKDAEIYKKELESQILDDDQENIENKGDQLNLLTEINIKQDIIIDLLTKLDSALLNLNDLIDA